MTFTIIAPFDDAQAAASAAAVLAQAAQAIAQWHQAHPFKSQKLFSSDGRQTRPSPAEKALGQRYGFDWRDGQDWLAVDAGESLDGVASAYRNAVYLTSGETDAAPDPWVALLAHLGAAALVDDGAGSVTVALEAGFRTAQQASAAATVIRDYLAADGIAPAPWLRYPGGDEAEDADALLALEPAYLAHLAAVQGDDYAAQIDSLPPLDVDDADWLDDARAAVAISAGRVMLDGAVLRLADLVFTEVASGLPALIVWLEASGAAVAGVAFRTG